MRTLVFAAAAVTIALAAPGSRAGEPAQAPADRLVAAFDKLFKGPYPGARAIHAKGVLCRGIFTPDPAAASLSSAAHLRDGMTVPVLVRFSLFSGIPAQQDGKPGTTPTGMSIKFQLPDGIDTDIVAHSYDGFPASTPEEFLDFVQMVASGDPAAKQAYLAGHPAARRFMATPKPTPVSYATEAFYGVDAFRFTNAAAVSHFGRYRIYPIAGRHYLADAAAAALAPDYLRHELEARLHGNPTAFRLAVQVAAPDDDPTDPGMAWPDDRREVTLGTLALTAIVDDADPLAQSVFFSPMNLVPGIAPSGDPMLTARTRAYGVSYYRRTEAE